MVSPDYTHTVIRYRGYRQVQGGRQGGKEIVGAGTVILKYACIGPNGSVEIEFHSIHCRT